MDRARQRSRLDTWGWPLLRGVVAVAVLAGLWLAALSWLRPGPRRSEIRLATVEAGRIDATVSATGTLVPQNEETVSSPIRAEVAAVEVTRGSSVSAGEVLLRLDTTAVDLAVRDLDERIALRQAELRSRRLELDDTVGQTESRIALLQIDLESRRTRAGRLARLAEMGISSDDELHEAELDVRRTEIELEQTGEALVRLEARRDADLERLQLERSLLEQQRAEQQRRRDAAVVRAPRAGLLVRLPVQEGGAVEEGQLLAAIASVDAFQVEATLSDFYAPELVEGQRVRVRSSSGQLEGTLVRVLPESEGSLLSIFVHLDDPRAPGLRANLRVEVEIVTASRESTLRIQRGPTMAAGARVEAFALEGEELVRRALVLGLAGTRTIEIREGAEVGEQIVISDMTRYEGRDRVPIR